MKENEMKKMETLGIEELESRMEMALLITSELDQTTNNKCQINNVAGCGAK
ncbi:MAG: hypothetical protein H6510_02715 [Acidobacteria bacterium]|nr:hypothetical protein [Acidobacteriota bacterium]MCB9396708.1 hypothetical protein [Acidobacteriota bacterium]